MKVNGKHYRTVWKQEDGVVQIINQRHLPFAFEIEDLRSVSEVCVAIKDMHVRGAGCIGATAGWGMYLAALSAAADAHSGDHFNEILQSHAADLIATRPTAVNLAWAVKRQLAAIAQIADVAGKVARAEQVAAEICDEDSDWCRRIGEHGVKLIRQLADHKPAGGVVNVLTHCNAGWLAFVDHGSATAPIYAAHDAGIPVHVWVDETRPRNQGARLTAWELAEHGVPHTVIVDNAGGHLMQRGLVDLVITGTDRTTFTGDVANKIGTYLKALAARDNGVPFYVALPSSTIDWETSDGMQIPIEQRDSEEVTVIEGVAIVDGSVQSVKLTPGGSAARNDAFDVTPARLVTGLICERGFCAASEAGVRELFPERS
ncbi:MAG: S-methyl-5-thioribose-1-phosphate isomerase [Verrucomicrobia bacterium]|nr:S-methyl-5-thioribose-1-phosphate isomerase [Verrucomicrobiota bacterium]